MNSDRYESFPSWSTTETKANRSGFKLSGQSHVNAKKEMYGGLYELMPV